MEGAARAEGARAVAPASEGELDRVEHLYEISKLLTEFHGVDQTVPEVLAIANDTIPLRSAVLIVEIGGRTQTLAWPAEGAPSDRRREIVARAQACGRYFAGAAGMRSALDLAVAVGGAPAGPADAGPRSPFVALPLVVDHQNIFGILQLELASRDETALSFASAVTNQVAVAIDRHEAWRRDRELRALAEAARARAERMEARSRFLAEAGAILVGSLDYRETLASVARLVAGGLADCCIVDVMEHDGRTLGRTIAHADPDKRALADELARVEIDRGRPHAARRVIEEQRSILLPDVPPGYLESMTQGEEHLRLWRELAPRSLMSTPLVARGRSLGAMTFVSSTGGHRYDEADLRAAEELARLAAIAVDNARLYREAQRAIRDRDEVLGIVAHDLRDPVHAVGMAAKMLLAQPAGGGEAGARRTLERIARSADRMRRLIEDLLDVTRIEAGKLGVEPVPVAPGQLVAEAADAARATTSSAALALDWAVAEGLPAVLGDRDRILQVFSNLVSNAAKFTPAGGRVSLGAARDDGGVRFWVADTGPGIAEEARLHVFDRFYQVDARDRRGAGLGLPICKGIVEAHGGSIWVESEPGRGARFAFRLPCAP